MEDTMVNMEDMEEEGYSFEEYWNAAEKVLNAVFDEQTPQNVQDVLKISKEAYDKGIETVEFLREKFKAVARIVMAMKARIFGTRAIDETPFDQVVTRAMAELPH